MYTLVGFKMNFPKNKECAGHMANWILLVHLTFVSFKCKRALQRSSVAFKRARRSERRPKTPVESSRTVCFTVMQLSTIWTLGRLPARNFQDINQSICNLLFDPVFTAFLLVFTEKLHCLIFTKFDMTFFLGKPNCQFCFTTGQECYQERHSCY